MTGVLVRSAGSFWAKNSILAVDAGVHLSAITSIIGNHLPGAIRPKHAESSRGPHASSSGPVDSPKLVMTTGPFRDLLLPHETAKANALHLLQNYVSTYLITHPHLDHLSGFVINTAAFQHTTRRKTLAALPHAINAIKAHIFNDIIWPNLSDEEGGVGLVSYHRLTEGGNIALGAGDRRGYIQACDGLAVKGWAITHGDCIMQPSQRGSINQEFPFPSSSDGRRGSRPNNPLSPTYRRQSSSHSELNSKPNVVDSSAFFILDERSGKEILIFGDVEPDSISTDPRTYRVWADAAPKVDAGILRAIFIECSYDDSQKDNMLFGHLNPRHLIAELSTLAEKVANFRKTGNPNYGGASTGSAKSLSHPSQASTSDADSPRKRRYDGSQRSGDDGSQRLRDPPPSLSASTSEPQRGRTPSPLSHQPMSSSVSPGTRASRSGFVVQGQGVPPHLRNPDASPTSVPLPAGPMQTRSQQTSPGRTSFPRRSPREVLADVNRLRTNPGQFTPAMRAALEYETWSGNRPEPAKPLADVKVVVIHIKDTMKDGPPASDLVLAQLIDHAEAAGLGCEILVAKQGESFNF